MGGEGVTKAACQALETGKAGSRRTGGGRRTGDSPRVLIYGAVTIPREQLNCESHLYEMATTRQSAAKSESQVTDLGYFPARRYEEAAPSQSPR
jgi:hypothetical protein